MTSRIIERLATRRTLLAGGAAVGGAGFVGAMLSPGGDNDLNETAAEIQFKKSFGFVVKGKEMIKPPEGWKGPLFQIRNDYPRPLDYDELGVGKRADIPPMPGPDRPIPGFDPKRDAPWLQVDFVKDPMRYCQLIKEYCWEGNVNHGFDPWKNYIRSWFHAPWMHWNPNGREPLNGLTFERSTPKHELSKTQDRELQTWAVGLYNWIGATSFGKIWNNPNKPIWEKFEFPIGTCVFKLLFTDATDHEVPSMKGAPMKKAVITLQGAKHADIRNDYASDLRLLQFDFAVRDHRAPTGWVFGTYMYDGSIKEANPWDRIIPVGIMWGNDPWLTPKRAAEGDKPCESWINPAADRLRQSLGGKRPSWGWNGRMNGPADNFISACSSCHSTSQKSDPVNMTFQRGDSDKEKMRWFRNIKAGEPFTPGNVSGDYSLQLMIGYTNYRAWENERMGIFHRIKMVVPGTSAYTEAKAIEQKRRPLRAGPEPFDADNRPK